MNPFLFQARILRAKRSLRLQAIRCYNWKRKQRRNFYKGRFSTFANNVNFSFTIHWEVTFRGGTGFFVSSFDLREGDILHFASWMDKDRQAARKVSNVKFLNVKLAMRAFAKVCLSADSRLIGSCTGIQDEIIVCSEFPVPHAVNIGQNINSFY